MAEFQRSSGIPNKTSWYLAGGRLMEDSVSSESTPPIKPERAAEESRPPRLSEE